MYAYIIDETISKSAEQLKRHEEPGAYDDSGLIYSHPQVRNEYFTFRLKRDHTYVSLHHLALLASSDLPEEARVLPERKIIVGLKAWTNPNDWLASSIDVKPLLALIKRSPDTKLIIEPTLAQILRSRFHALFNNTTKDVNWKRFNSQVDSVWVWPQLLPMPAEAHIRVKDIYGAEWMSGWRKQKEADVQKKGGMPKKVDTQEADGWTEQYGLGWWHGWAGLRVCRADSEN